MNILERLQWSDEEKPLKMKAINAARNEGQGNFSVEDLGTAIKVRARNRRVLFAIILFGYLLGLTLVIEKYIGFHQIFSMIFRTITFNGRVPLTFTRFTFSVIFFAPSILFAILLFIEFLFFCTGIETMVVDRGSIVLKHRILGIEISKTLHSNKIDSVFVSRYHLLRGGSNTKSFFFVFKIGKIAINYGKGFLGFAHTFRFGSDLGPADAIQIVKMIHNRFPQYDYRKKTRA